MPSAVDLNDGGQMALLWLVRSLSLFNTVALLWLGLTVLLNVQRRSAGSWVAGGGLTLGGAFFAVHSTIVGQAPGIAGAELRFWWPLAWWMLIAAPFSWLLVVAWYNNGLRAPYTLGGALGFVALAVVMLIAAPFRLEDLTGRAGFRPGFEANYGLVLTFAAYGVTCFLLSLLALKAPAPSDRLMGDVARQRALPWLLAATVALLGVSLSICGVLVWFPQGLAAGRLEYGTSDTWFSLLVVDAGIAAEVAAAVVLMGRAIVSYEVFTGRTLPRQGLLRHWRRSLILAAGQGAIIAASLAFPVPPIYPLVFATLTVTVFYALLSWRLFLERERTMAQLRAFAPSEHLYEQVSDANPAGLELEGSLASLCEDVLGAASLTLAPLGPLTSLLPGPLVHPPGAAAAALPAQVQGWTPGLPWVELPGTSGGGADWAVPLWSEHGLIGVLLMGPKRDGGLYTEEEMEVARAAGERLLDALATAALTRRLMLLQRQRLAESQLLDQRTRRVLHDDVLPQLQTAMLQLNAGAGESHPQTAAVTALLGDVHRQIAALLRELPSPFSAEVAKLGALTALRRAITDELDGAFHEIRWCASAEAEAACRRLSAVSAEVLFAAAREAARNAARHGRPADGQRFTLSVTAVQREGLEVCIADDGVGFTGSPGEGHGHGLALYATMLTVIGGSLVVDGHPGATRITLVVPVPAAAEA